MKSLLLVCILAFAFVKGYSQSEPPPCSLPTDTCSAPWIIAENLNLEVTECGIPNVCPNTCFVKVRYAYRKCGVIQDLQILSITYNSELCKCPPYSFEPGAAKDRLNMLYASTFLRLMAENSMNFEPKNLGDCYTTWRLSTGACANETTFLDEFGNTTFDKKSSMCPGSPCCATSITFCWTLTGEWGFNSNQTPLSEATDCQNPLNPQLNSCTSNCDWMFYLSQLSNTLIYESNKNLIRLDKSLDKLEKISRNDRHLRLFSLVGEVLLETIVPAGENINLNFGRSDLLNTKLFFEVINTNNQQTQRGLYVP